MPSNALVSAEKKQWTGTDADMDEFCTFYMKLFIIVDGRVCHRNPIFSIKMCRCPSLIGTRGYIYIKGWQYQLIFIKHVHKIGILVINMVGIYVKV